MASGKWCFVLKSAHRVYYAGWTMKVGHVLGQGVMAMGGFCEREVLGWLALSMGQEFCGLLFGQKRGGRYGNGLMSCKETMNIQQLGWLYLG